MVMCEYCLKRVFWYCDVGIYLPLVYFFQWLWCRHIGYAYQICTQHKAELIANVLDDWRNQGLENLDWWKQHCASHQHEIKPSPQIQETN